MAAVFGTFCVGASVDNGASPSMLDTLGKSASTLHHASSKPGVLISVMITLSALALLGLGTLIFCHQRLRRGPTTSNSNDSLSDTSQAYRDEPHDSPPFFPAAAEPASEEDITRNMTAEPSGLFSASESSVPRSRMHSQHFELGSSISTSSEEDVGSDEINGLDDPFSDTAFISSLARPSTPMLSTTAVWSAQQSSAGGTPTAKHSAILERSTSVGEQDLGKLGATRLPGVDGAANDTELRASRSTGGIVR